MKVKKNIQKGKKNRQKKQMNIQRNGIKSKTNPSVTSSPKEQPLLFILLSVSNAVFLSQPLQSKIHMFKRLPKVMCVLLGERKEEEKKRTQDDQIQIFF